MFQSQDNAALAPLVDAIKNIQASGATMPFQTSGFRLDTLIDGVAPISGAATAYSRYEGSLTTPTCNEAVQWINFLTPLKISSMQLAMFRYDKYIQEIFLQVDSIYHMPFPIYSSFN